jgi:hypothetical protein
VWKRLRLIASEDVGVASTETVIAVRALNDSWLELRKAARLENEAGIPDPYLEEARAVRERRS